MFRRLIPVVAILGLATVVSTAASAQDSSAMKAGIAKPTYQVFVSAVNATPATITALKARPTITAGEVTLISVRDFPEAQNDSAVVVLLEPYTTQIAELRTVLGTQAEVTALLQSQTPGLTVADVVAVGEQEDGKLLVFFRPKGQ